MISNGIDYIYNFWVDVFEGITQGAISALGKIVDSLSGITDILDSIRTVLADIYLGFLELVGSVVPFIPQDWINILVTFFLITIVGIIIKKKVVG